MKKPRRPVVVWSIGALFVCLVCNLLAYVSGYFEFAYWLLWNLIP